MRLRRRPVPAPTGYPGLDIQAVVEQREREQQELIDGMTSLGRIIAPPHTDRREHVMARRVSAFLDFKSEDAALAEQAQADLEAWLAERADTLDSYGTRVSDEVVFPTDDTP